MTSKQRYFLAGYIPECDVGRRDTELQDTRYLYKKIDPCFLKYAYGEGLENTLYVRFLLCFSVFLY
jgi:hypothetical protein